MMADTNTLKGPSYFGSACDSLPFLKELLKMMHLIFPLVMMKIDYV